MKRRKFLSRITTAAAITPILINGLPMRVLGAYPHLKRYYKTLDDRILVLIQLHGGNDGLNMLVPVQQYATYKTLRGNIAIPDSGTRKYIELDSTLAAADQVGLHPDMTPVKTMYDAGKVSIVQGVGYENTNQSHFRSRDIWYMGGDYDEYKNSGWMGRYLDYVFPNYPDDYPNNDMPDPLGLEIGNKVSLGYYRSQGIPTAIATPNNPGDFSSIISGLGGPNPSVIPTDHYGLELQNIIDLYANANDYAQQLEDRYNAGSNNVIYPSDNVMQYPGSAPAQYLKNQLGGQLQTVARLIHGGCKTKIYLVRIEGYDTHNSQVTSGSDTTHGAHGALLYHLSTAVKAFFDDLAISGYDEDVVAMTFTDFGRRPTSNFSLGTDHGTSSPTFVFGKHVQPGIVGTNPSLTNLDSTGNLLVQNDYRQIITTLLCDWMGADTDALAAAEFSDFANQKLPLINTGTGIYEQAYSDIAVNIYPNPVKDNLKFTLNIRDSRSLEMNVYSPGGQRLYGKHVTAISGSNTIETDISTLPTGFYILRLQDGNGKSVSKRFIKQ